MWLNILVSSGISSYEKQLAQLKSQVTEINRKRKADQLSIAPELQRLEAEFYELVQKNVAIEAACKQLENAKRARQSTEWFDSSEKRRKKNVLDQVCSVSVHRIDFFIILEYWEIKNAINTCCEGDLSSDGLLANKNGRHWRNQ